MLYADNEYKFVIVVNRKIDLPKLLNAVGHMVAGLIAQSENLEEMRFLRYEDADGTSHPAISRYPFIILAAKNGNQIRSLRSAAREAGVIYNDFVDTMLGSSAEDQMKKTRDTREADLEYFGIAMFGPSAVLNGMTKKYSLFNGVSSTE